MSLRVSRKRGWVPWAVYGLAALLVIEGLAWASWRLASVERAQAVAEAEARAEQRLRLALWRMDSLVVPLLARESVRPYYHYLPRHAADAPYGRAWDVSGAQAVAVSPLAVSGAATGEQGGLSESVDPIRLHAQVEPDGSLTVPAAVGGEEGLAGAAAAQRARRLGDRLAEILELDRSWDRVRAVAGASLEPGVIPGMAPAGVLAALDDAAEEGEVGAAGPVGAAEADEFGEGGYGYEQKAELATRQRAASRALSQLNVPPQVESLDSVALLDRAPAAWEGLAVGAFRPVWLGGGGRGGEGSPELVLVRGVRYGGDVRAQLVWIDWPRLRGSLLAEAAGLVPGLVLEPLVERDARGVASGVDELATIPVRAVGPEVEVVSAGWLGGLSGATGAALAATWAGALAALVAIGVVLWVSRRLAEQRWRFVTAVTHELRTPLTGLRLHTELLARGGDGGSGEGQRERVEAVRADADRLVSVVESVLAYARLSTTASDPARGAVVGDAVAEAVRTVGPLLASRGMELVLDADAVRGRRVRLDQAGLVRVLVNLLENAARHGGKGEGGTVGLFGEAEGGQVRLVVADDGPGVPRGRRRRVLRAFVGSEGGGSGLGLALARELARAGGGRLRVIDPPAGARAAGLGGAAFEVVLAGVEPLG